eukprot:CAMPEP_0172445806 /NCGR_PEP_ID=MMETSP1065-20121228/5599_1 /TAXON_ID=265537 /ORGANISM="Amphiprora paludosa, Strain CCMP125" /LENGTH=52 /DNA_ID=CAMNT_0013196791 /DNA_START=35 /DNA_END=189 /DNA_ORIENTATION=-
MPRDPFTGIPVTVVLDNPEPEVHGSKNLPRSQSLRVLTTPRRCSVVTLESST